MAASTIPITFKRLGMEGNLDTEFLGNSLKEIAGHPEMVSHFNADAGANLEFPLRGHDFGVDTADVYTSVQARLVVGLNDVTGVDFAGSDAAVVWALRSWETADGPAVWFSKGIEKRVLLLETEPGLVLSVFFHQLGAFGAVVELVWCTIRIVAFGEHEDVVPATERVGVHGNRFEVHI